ncbi:MAG: response regulator, partial [Bacteroidota bacterium]
KCRFVGSNMLFMKKVLIFLVDDDEDDREVFLEALHEVNDSFLFVTAEDGEKALKYLSDASNRLPDLIFLDMNMPRLDGRQCLQEIKKSPRLSSIPVVVYSTTKREDDVRETTRLGAVHFLTKPVLFHEITSALSDMINRFISLKQIKMKD